MNQPFARRVWVPWPIGVGVVLHVVRSPLYGRPLDRHRATDEEHGTQHGMRLEAPVGEHTVVPDGDTQAGDDKADQEQRDVATGVLAGSAVADDVPASARSAAAWRRRRA